MTVPDRRPSSFLRRRWTVPAAAAFALLAAAAPLAHAAETQWWIVDQASDHAESELHGATIRPEGAIELGPKAASSAAESLGTIWAIALLPDGAVALAGDRGRIDRWTESGGVRPWVKLPVGQVLSLARDGDGLVAGTGPEGSIYRIGARGDTSLVVRSGDRYVWGLVAGAKGVWFAATGTRGRVLRIEGRTVRIALDTDESNLVSMVSDGAGGVYAGGDSKGRVVHVRADGTTRTVFDAPEDEVRGLALGTDGAVYAAALGSSAVSGATSAGDDDAAGGDAAAAAGTGVAPVRTAPAGRAVIYRIVPDSSAATWWVAPQPLVYALAQAPGGLVAATGNRAGVYVVPAANGGMPWLAAPQGQITALAVAGDGRVFAAASNPAALWRLGPGLAATGEVISRVFDARRIAGWGRIRWLGDARGGRVDLATRSGNTDTPDTTWTAWQRAANGERVASPAGRYLQWQVTLTGGTPRVESVEVAWREQNLPPRVEDIVVAPQGGSFREGDLMPRSEPVTQTLPGGQKVEYSIPSPSTPRQLRGLPAWASGVRTVQWKASDPNGDPLHFRVDVARSLEGPWTMLGEALDAPAFTWDTHTLPDGAYRVRVTADDAAGNAVGEERTTAVISEPFHVDNSPPAITAFTAAGARGAIRIEGAARDGESALTRIEVAVDSGDWRPVAPEGGFADDLTLSFRATVGDIDPGEHQVGVRVVDRAGNTATRATRVTVAARP